MKNIFFLLLVITCSNSFGNTDRLFDNLYNGLKERRLLLRHEIKNIQKQYENDLNKSSQIFALKRLSAILKVSDSISTKKVNKNYIINNVTKLMKSIKFDMDNTKLATPKQKRQVQFAHNNLFPTSSSIAKAIKVKNSPKEIQTISIKQSALKAATQDLNSSHESGQAKTNIYEYLVFVVALCLMFIAGRKSRTFNNKQSCAPTSSSNNQSKITMTKLLTFLTKTFSTPALICDSKQQVKWSNSFCEKDLDIQANDIFDFHAESVLLGAHRYFKCSDTYYLIQSRKIKNKILYFFVPLEIGPALAASNVVTSVHSIDKKIDKKIDNFRNLIEDFKDVFQTQNTSLELTTNINTENLCSPINLSIIHSFLDSLLETIESEPKSHVSIKLDIAQSKSQLNLDFDVSNISSNALRFAFSVNQKKLEDLNLSCTFFNSENGIKAKVLYRSSYLLTDRQNLC